TASRPRRRGSRPARRATAAGRPARRERRRRAAWRSENRRASAAMLLHGQERLDVLADARLRLGGVGLERAARDQLEVGDVAPRRLGADLVGERGRRAVALVAALG